MPWGAIAGAVIGAYSTNQSNKAANKGAKGATDAAQASIDEQRREYDQSRADQLPFLQFGQWAIPQQQAFLSGDFSGFENSPDYKYALQQGLGAVDNRAAARGGLFGGGNSRDAMTFASGLATQNVNSYWDKLAGISGKGQTSAADLGALGATMAGNIGNQYANAANARQSAYNTIAGNNSQFAAGVAGSLNNWYQQYRNSQYGGGYASGYSQYSDPTYSSNNYGPN